MGKLKTIKAVSKRIQLTKNDKVLKMPAGQDHFNSRESGKVTRQKRKRTEILNKAKKNIKRFNPYA